MKTYSVPDALQGKMALFVFLCCAVLVFLIYSYGFSGALYYDDFRPLSGLSRVDNFYSALLYIFSDTSGPLGRPLSMLTFLLNRSDWPDATDHILRFNVCVHIVNGLLIAALTYTLARLVNGERASNAWLATGVAVFWLALPMHVSTSLIAVQRMTSLSAMFVFAGLLIYLQGIRVQLYRPRLGLLGQVLGVGLFTLLAIFSKENGALLPVLVLTLELTLLAGVAKATPWRGLRISVFTLSLSVLVGYLAYTTFGAESAYATRKFTLYERIITQPLILLEYLRLAFFPDVFSFHPFHDGHPHLASLLGSPKGLFAVCLWGGGLLLALVFRRKWPLPAFAILWFLSAHMLESSVIGLELYFEHRNYVALFGPCLAVVWGVGKVPFKYARLVAVGGFLYMLIMLVALFQVTSLWGDREEAARVWFENSYRSARAAEHYAAFFTDRNQLVEAWQVMKMQVDDCPDCIGSQAQAMLLACVVGDEEGTHKYQAAILSLAAQIRSIGGVPATLDEVHKHVADGSCKFLSLNDLVAMNEALLRFQSAGLGIGQRQAISVNLHQLAYAQGDKAGSIKYIRDAWGAIRDLTIGEVLVENLIYDERISEARRFVLMEMCSSLPRNPFLASSARQRCSSAMSQVEAAEAKSKG